MAGFRVRLPKLDRHKRGQARVRIKGRTFYCGRYGTPEAEERYRQLIAEYVQTGAAPEPPAAPDDVPSVNEVIVRFWKEHVAVAYRKNGEPTSEVSLFKSALGIVADLYGTLPIAELTPSRLRTARGLMIQSEAKGGKNWTRQSANGQTRRIKQMVKWAVEHELVAPSVFHALQAVAGLKKGRTAARENRKVPPVPLRDLKPALRHLPPVLRDMVRFQFRTGCRPGEVCDICPGDVSRDGDVWVYVPGSHKTEHHGRERRVFIGPKAYRIIAPYLKRKAGTPCFSPREADAQRRAAKSARRKTPLSCGNRPGSNVKAKPEKTPGERWDENSYGRAIRRACKVAGVAPWSPNQLRHNTATMIRKRFGLEEAQTVLGHANAKVTEIYAERDFAKARAVAAEIG